MKPPTAQGERENQHTASETESRRRGDRHNVYLIRFSLFHE